MRPSTLLLTATMLPGLSLATDEKQSDLETKESESVTVYGELMDRSVQDTHSSVFVVTGNELESKADMDLYDVIERTPGVSSSFGEKGFAIRGIDQRGVGGGSGGLTVSTTVDGATISNSNQLTFFGPYSTWDLEQVEILRGPQSTQTGRNALAGAINIRSKDPTYDLEGKAQFVAGQRDTKGMSIAVNTPLIDDKVAIRFAADLKSTDGFVENPTLNSDSYDSRKLSTMRLGLRLDPTDDLDIVFKISDTENKGGEDYVSYSDYPGERLNFSNENATEGSDILSYNLRAGLDLDKHWRLESETTYYEAEYERLEDGDNSAAPVSFLYRNAEVDNIQQELRFHFENENLNAVFGAFYTKVDDDAPAGGVVPAALLNAAFAPLGAFIDAKIDDHTKTENSAIFGELEYALDEKLKLILGARYDREKIDSTTVNDFYSENMIVASFLPPATTESTSASYNAFLPKAGLVYDANDDLSFGLTIQQGYRAGGTYVNLFRGERGSYDPEYTTNYELSMRSQWMEGAITANANLFYTDWEDQQVTVALSSNESDTITENAGESNLYGAELQLEATVASSLDLFTSFAYVKTEFDEYDSSIGSFDRNAFPHSSELSASAGATYYFDNGFYVGADVSYKDDAFSDIENTELTKSDSRTLLNSNIGYSNDEWNIYAFVRNLTDKDYILQATESAGAIELVRTGEPRTVGVVAKLSL